MKKFLLNLTLLLFFLSVPFALYGQSGTIAGKVTDTETGEDLVGANVSIDGTSMGDATLVDGAFEIAGVPVGTYNVKAVFIGYETAITEVKVVSGRTVSVDFELQPKAILGTQISVLADRAKPRETPVAFTDVNKEEMNARLGSQDIPLVLNTTPSVYATMQGGGAGDARVNIRGFNQRNVAIMINGVPVNDMENGWLYWSNWDGLADATSSIQVQRGLSAVNLATPSIGGTMNILTDPTALDPGLRYKQEFGNDGFLKSTLTANSGLIDGKYALSAVVVRKTGDGIIDATWTDAWAYYLGASWQMNKDNRLEVYAMGAPQRHGQNLYKQNAAVYDREFVEDQGGYNKVDTLDASGGSSPNGISDYFDKYHEKGRYFNQNWAPVDPSYSGQQYWNGSSHDRYAEDFINSRENFYHKPIVNLNWYSNFSENTSLYSTVYYSGGTGGGTGTYGDLIHQSAEGSYDHSWGKFYYFGAPWTWDWDATIAINRDSTHAFIDKSEFNKKAGQSLGILRNSCNNQWTVGAISKLNVKLSDKVHSTIGIDWRTAEIDHFRQVRDLLGGNYFDPRAVGETVSDFWASEDDFKLKLGDKVAYNFTNSVDWLGFFGQTEYSTDLLNTYAMAGYSTIKYTYTNHFRASDTLANGNPDPNSSELTAETDWISGYQVKAGAGYRITENMDVFANVGYVNRVPIFDDVINDRTGSIAEDPKNEKFLSVEGGINYWGMDGKLMLKGNFYYTSWRDKSRSLSISNEDGSEGIIFVQGTGLLHSGIELEAAFQPISLFRLDLSAALGNWKYTDDVSGVYKDYSSGGANDVHYNFYIDGLKSGDAPQTQLAVVGSVYPVTGLSARFVGRYYDNHYADWDPFSRTRLEDVDGDGNANERPQSWKAPGYFVMDFHGTYDLPFDFKGVQVQLFAHVFNLLDATYIQDAVDNSKYNAWDHDHDIDDAEVFFGLPRTFNVGLSVAF